MEEIKEKIKKQKIKNYTFKSYDYNDTKLDDNVILYNCGNLWRTIPLNIMLSFPIIHDIYLYGDEKYDITVVVCPITLQTVMFKGKFFFYDYEKNKMILTNDKKTKYIPIDSNKKNDENFVMEENKRIEVKILTLKNAILYINDLTFIKIKIKKNANFIINDEYYFNTKDMYGNEITYNSVHPKTLVYVVSFESHTKNQNKFVILIGNDYSNNEISGYDVTKSKLNEHLIKHRSKIIKKNGFITPMLWYIAKELYKNAKLIYLK